MMRRYLCWDMDETLGEFRGPGKKAAKGMRPLIEDLGGRGCLNVITTGAEADYARQGIEAAGLGGIFARIFDRSLVWKGGPGKVYGPAAECMRIDRAEAQDRMIAIGNSEIDIPTDLDIVTIIAPFGAEGGGALRSILGALISPYPVWWSYEAMLSRFPRRHVNGFFEGGEARIAGEKVFAGRIKDNPYVQQAERIVCLAGPAQDGTAWTPDMVPSRRISTT